MNINEFRITYALPTYLCEVKRRNNIDQSYVWSWNSQILSMIGRNERQHFKTRG